MIYLIAIILLLAVLIWRGHQRALRNVRLWEAIERFGRESGGTEQSEANVPIISSNDIL